MGESLSHLPGYCRHLSARPKVDLAVMVDIPGHLSHFR
jgi:hypothetical protein